MKNKSTILIFSGGVDSTVLLYKLLNDKIDVKCLSVNYGQKHKKELEYAKRTCLTFNIEHKIIDLECLGQLSKNSSLTNDLQNVPDGHYEEDSMKSTIVPNRNMILISLAASWAITTKSDTISYAAHFGDHAIYPDCRSSFAKYLNKTLELCDWHKISLYRPFINLTKTQICEIGKKLNVSFNKTWSCYKGEDLHCGICGTCIERREALYLANINDLTKYKKEAPSLKQMLVKKWKLNEL